MENPLGSTTFPKINPFGGRDVENAYCRPSRGLAGGGLAIGVPAAPAARVGRLRSDEAKLQRNVYMKWVSATVAIVLSAAPLIPGASAQTATPLTYAQLTYAQPLSPAGVAAVQQRLKQAGVYAGRTECGAGTAQSPLSNSSGATGCRSKGSSTKQRLQPLA